MSPAVPKIKPKIREHLAVVEIDGESVVLDRANGRLHHLNAPATAIFLSCDGRLTQDELVDELAAVFGGSRDQIATDVETLVNGMRASGLLEGDGTEGCAGCGDDMQEEAT